MEIMKGDKLGRQGGSQEKPMKGDNEAGQGGSGSQEQPRMEITKGDKCRQERPRAGQNGNHEGGQMKGDK